MTSLSVILVLISAVIHIGWNSLTKSSAHPRVFSLFKGTLLMALALALPFQFNLLLIPAHLWGLIVLSGVVHALYILSLSTAYEKGDISFVYPIVRSAPAFVPLVAFIVFAETVSLRGGIGIAIVVTCILVLLLQGKLEGFGDILRVFLKRENVWAFVTLGTVVTYSVIDKAGMMSARRLDEVPGWGQGIVYFLFENTICYSLYWLFMLGKRDSEWVAVWRREWWKMGLAALGTITSYGIILHVMKTENLSYIVTLRQSSILFAVFIGWFFFRERQFRLRLLVSIVMILGLYLTATA
jgi:uncharacterized membrane protein